MNVKNYLKAAAVALPLAVAPVKASAQSQNIVKAAERVLAADTLKAMDAKAKDARVLTLTSYKGKFCGDVKAGKINNGTLDYAEKGHDVPLMELANANKKTMIGFEGSYIHANGLPSDAFKLEANIRRGNNEYGAHTMYSSGGGKSNFGGGGSYTRDFPLLNDHKGSKLEAFGRLSATADIRRDRVTKPIDHLGILHTDLVGGIKGNKKIGDFNLGGEAYVGGGESIRLKANSDKKDSYSHLSYGGKIKVGFKKVYAFVTGGKAPETEGGFIGAGAGVKF